MTVTVELLNNDALLLLRYLERLHVLKLTMPATTKPPAKSAPKKSRFSGRISPQTAEQLQQQLAQMRKEWR